MPALESKKGGEDWESGQSAEGGTAISDIENALNFLDSEEFQEVHQPISHTKNKLKNQSVGKTNHDASKALTSGIDSVKFPKQKDSTIKTAQRRQVPLPPQIEKKTTKITPEPLDRPKSQKSGIIWFLCLGTAALIFFTILALY